MKKKILLLGILFCTLNVSASPIYSDYNFIGYTLEPLTSSENYTYESLNLHRYYSTRETNIVYARLDDEISMSPYIDMNDTIKGTYYLGGRPRYSYPKPKIYMKLKESYPINTINILDFYSYEFDVYEIEVFYKNKKINYEIPDNYSFLNDGDIYNGRPILSESFKITLDDYYDIKDIKIIVHYYADMYLLDFFTIEYVNESGNNYLAYIRLDNYNSEYMTESLEFKVGDAYVNFLVENNILLMEDAITNTLNTVFEYEYPLYKHYNLEKVYYINSFEDEIEGYTYDEEEDILVYKVYAKEYLGDDTPIEEKVLEPVECIKPEALVNLPVEDKKIEQSLNIEEINTDNKDDEFVYQVIPVSNKIETMTETDSAIETNNQKKIKIVIIIVFMICLIIVTIKLIKLLCDKFTEKF